MKNMKPQVKQEKQTKARKIEIVCSVSGSLLSVVCCIALIHMERKIQEHHRLISHSTAFCEQMEIEILRKVQIYSEGRQDDNEGHATRGLYFFLQCLNVFITEDKNGKGKVVSVLCPISLSCQGRLLWTTFISLLNS